MPLKNQDEIELMRRAGLVLWGAHQQAARRMEPGVTTREVDQAVEDCITSHNAIPLFKGVPGEVPFPAATCVSINNEVVHGIPSSRTLSEGDVVSIDIGVKLDGWCADAAVTHPVGSIDAQSQKLLQVTEHSLRLAIGALRKGVRWSKIARKMQQYIEGEGFSVVEELVGHAIGRELWEPPQVPNFFSRRMHDFKVKQGLVLAIEPMVNAGKKEVIMMPDHWTVATRDGTRSAHFEHTIAITEDGPRVLTCGPDGQGWAM
ncbi:MAG: type I methionyl aminopeptidase [Geoalkalibacter sp.]|uniref:type I methionyl aminopeptidase n=1 Tax=Geoalkalibacter sp. TaxID=3041440 RepID=UPI003D0AFF91